MFEPTPSRTLSVSGAALPELDGRPLLTPVRLRGTEAFGALFDYTLELTAPDARSCPSDPAVDFADPALDALLGTKLTVPIQLEGCGPAHLGAGTREISALVTHAARGREDGRAHVLALTLRPWLWLATRNRDCRLFQDMTVPEITEAVLSAYPFPVDWRLIETYPKRELQRQHWESDFTFVCRLWQEWGIYFWFEHGDGHHRLVLCDSSGAHPPHGPAYRSLRYEPAGRLQAQLSSDHALSQLNLGSLARIAGHAGRQEPRGDGFELRTDAHGVLRAARGLLLTTEARHNAQAHAMDMDETVQRLTQARKLQERLTGLAQQHTAQEQDADQGDVVKSIEAQDDAIRGGTKTDENTFPEFSEPHLTLASSAGIHTTTAGSTRVASDEHLALTTGGHIGIASGKSLFASISEKFSLFVHRLGIKLIAASGKVRIEAQSDSVELVAKRVIEIISTTDWIELKAKQGIRLNGGGTELEISANGLIGFTDGQSLVHAADHRTAGPMNRPLTFPGRPDDFCERCFLLAAQSGGAIVPQ